ncbi:MAG: transcriptional regulator NrdR [Dehalococcoidia bacterium]|nr:transcriptional regulator NrdR [Dehalococcoidia bacterium]
MLCPYCDHRNSKVIDSRSVGTSIRRRRECLRCQSRFTTYEQVRGTSLFVIKKDMRREEFNRTKLLTGIRKACEKRPLHAGAVDKLVDDIEAELHHLGKTEVTSSVIGDMVMEKLRKLDHIAYIRFASVYRDFSDLNMLKTEVDSLSKGKEGTGRQGSQLPLLPKQEPAQTVRN